MNASSSSCQNPFKVFNTNQLVCIYRLSHPQHSSFVASIQSVITSISLSDQSQIFDSLHQNRSNSWRSLLTPKITWQWSPITTGLLPVTVKQHFGQITRLTLHKVVFQKENKFLQTLTLNFNFLLIKPHVSLPFTKEWWCAIDTLLNLEIINCF